MTPDPIARLATPCLLLDIDVLEQNAERMRTRVAGLGLTLRPHVKTAKCAEVVDIMLGDQPDRIAVSTVREAEWFFARGFQDILYAVGVAPSRFPRLAALARRGAVLTLLTDDLGVARELDLFTRRYGIGFKVLIELDVGAARAGLNPQSEALIELGRYVSSAPKLDFCGVLTHAGHAYGAKDRGELGAIAGGEARDASQAAARLRAAGVEAAVVSIGSSPSISALSSRQGATEARTGVYIFNDLDQVRLGVCKREDMALSVLATVIGHNRDRGRLLIDAGILALSKDLGLTPAGQVSYGEVCDPISLRQVEGIQLSGLHQEHGICDVSDPRAYVRLPVGSQVRIFPNHACITAAAFDEYVVVRDGLAVQRWKRIRGW